MGEDRQRAMGLVTFARARTSPKFHSKGCVGCCVQNIVQSMGTNVAIKHTPSATSSVTPAARRPEGSYSEHLRTRPIRPRARIMTLESNLYAQAL